MSSWLVFSSGLLAAFTAAVHLLAGGREIARPLLETPLEETLKLTLYACWHLVSVFLVLSSLALLACGAGLVDSRWLVGFVSALYVLFGVVFAVVTLGLARPRGLFRLPQWTLLIPVGVLGLWGLA